MTEVKVYPDGYSVEGHAGHGTEGNDIVCAGISAITQTTAKALSAYCHVNVKVEGSNLYVFLKNKSGKSTLLIGAMVIGLREIEKQFPKHLSIEERWK